MTEATLLEVKSFVNWLVEVKKEIVTVPIMFASVNSLNGLVNEFVKQVYKKEDVDIVIKFDTVNQTAKTIDVEFATSLPNFEHAHISVTIDTLAPLEQANTIISQVIYNLVKQKAGK